MAHEVSLVQEAVRELEAHHGSLRAVARLLDTDVAYIKRLRDGDKTNPSDDMCKKLGLEKIVSYKRIAV